MSSGYGTPCLHMTRPDKVAVRPALQVLATLQLAQACAEQGRFTGKPEEH